MEPDLENGLQDAHTRHRFEGEPEEDLIAALEPDQLVQAMETHLERRALSPATSVGLWVLRVYVLALTVMAVFAAVAGFVRHA